MLPSELLAVILPYATLFCKRTFRHAQWLLLGAVLAPGKRTVSSVLRIVGLANEKRFHKYHRLLSMTKWSAFQGSRLLLNQLLYTFVGKGPLIVGIDETLERRWGKRILARGIYRDAVRSSGSHFAKSSGLRWMSVMVLTKVKWAGRFWALPFLTALAPSERYYIDKPRTHKKLTDWARQLLLQVKRWVGERKVVAVGDSSYAAIELLKALQGKVSLISRLRLDAALYEPVAARPKGKPGRSRLKGRRFPTLEALSTQFTTRWHRLVITDWYGGQIKVVEYCTKTAVWYHCGKPPVAIRWVMVRYDDKLTGIVSNDLEMNAEEMISYFVRRWSIESTFALVRAHLGVESQRQWSQLAIARTTPVLMGLFSMVTLMADSLQKQGRLYSQASSWYRKVYPTFSDALACVRGYLWRETNFYMSSEEVVHVKMSQQQFLLWQSALSWAA